MHWRVTLANRRSLLVKYRHEWCVRSKPRRFGHEHTDERIVNVQILLPVNR